MHGGKASFLSRLYARHRPFRSLSVGERLAGASPPSVFIGRFGYPKVLIGPLVPPVSGDTREFDFPEAWLPSGKTAPDIIGFRLQLVRGKQAVSVRDTGRLTQLVREIALSEKPAEVEVCFSKRPTGGFLHEELQPFGPSAPIRELHVDAGRFEHNLERAYHDTDLCARDAIIELYGRGTPISFIQRALSVGTLGLGQKRKLVPTRWAITAVDSAISENILEEIKQLPPLENQFLVFEHSSLSNTFVIILFPSMWQFEWIEAFFPQVIGDRLEIFSDREGFARKTEYSSVGGCYYSARLAVCEKLKEMRKQAGALVLREAYSDYVPLGVWNVRENIRQALRAQPKEFESFGAALAHALSRLRLPLSAWRAHSAILKGRSAQTQLSAFLR
ncbi:MAG: Nre family DNA repair protein [Candidatus Micrarchaeia archaeon]